MDYIFSWKVGPFGEGLIACNCVVFIFRRLTPSYMFTILFYSNLYAFLGEGPMWFRNQNSTLCEKYWWTNLLYINNFYPTSLDDEVRYNSLVSCTEIGSMKRAFALDWTTCPWLRKTQHQ